VVVVKGVVVVVGRAVIFHDVRSRHSLSFCCPEGCIFDAEGTIGTRVRSVDSAPVQRKKSGITITLLLCWQAPGPISPPGMLNVPPSADPRATLGLIYRIKRVPHDNAVIAVLGYSNTSARIYGCFVWSVQVLPVP